MLSLSVVTVQDLASNAVHCPELADDDVVSVADGPPGHGDSAVSDLQESWGLVQRGTTTTGRLGPHCRQR